MVQALWYIRQSRRLVSGWLAASFIALALAGCGGDGGKLPGGTGATGSAGSVVVTVVEQQSGLSTTTINSSSTVVARALVRDGGGKPVANALVRFEDATGLPSQGLLFTPVTALTDSNGVASVTVSPVSATTAGAFAVHASVTLSQTLLSSSVNVAVTPTQVAQGTVTITVLDQGTGQPRSDLVFGTQASVKAVVKDPANLPIANAVVRFQSSDGNSIVFSPAATALTNASGEAVVAVGPAAASTAGAFTLTALSQVGQNVVQGSTNVSITATQTPSGSVSLSIIDASGLPTTTISSGMPVRAKAVVRGPTGQAIVNALVKFEEAGGSGALRFSPAATALTDVGGVATVDVAPANSATAGAFVVNASATFNQITVQDSKNLAVAPTLPTQGSIAMSVLDPSTSLSKTTLTYGTGAVAQAVVRNGTGQPVANTIVTFGGVLATEVPGTVTPPALTAPIVFTPARTALTNSQGVATVNLSPNAPAAAGAFTIIAQADVNQSTIQSIVNVYVSPTQPSSSAINLSIVNQATGLTTNALSFITQTVARAVVRDGAGQPVPNALVTFTSTDSSAIRFTPAATALTDSSGVASVNVGPVALTTAGAYAISASTQGPSQSVFNSVNVTIGATQVSLGALSFATAPLSAYGTTVVSVPVTGVPASTPVQIRFTSVCAAQNPAKATITAVVTSSGGVARTTYVDQGCAGSDLITATVEGTSTTVTANLTIAVPALSNMQFVGASPSAIVLRGTGGVGLSEVAVARFRLVDQLNRPITIPTNVTLALSNNTGGLTIDGVAGPVVRQTDVNGEVSVGVRSGTLPTPFWVLATVDVGGDSRTTSSTLLTVSTGRPVQSRFAIAVRYFNLEGWRYISGATTLCPDVTCAEVIAELDDRLGNPVPDGTVVNFISEGGSFDRAFCLTISGTCSVVFRSANPKLNDGRSTIVAYAVGEEDFDDTNLNNRYDAGETFYELGSVFIDSNENRAPNPLEPQIPFTTPLPGGGVACVNAQVPTFGVPSVPDTCDGVWGPTFVRGAAVITFSDSFGAFKRFSTPPFNVPSDLATIPYPLARLGDVCVASVPFWLNDVNGNPLPYGTTFTATVAGVTNANASVEATQVPSSTNVGGTFHVATVSVPYDEVNLRCPPALLTIRATTPLNNQSVVTVPIGQ